jgi:16S rRNA (uracil1498-N3)-methyltransferase
MLHQLTRVLRSQIGDEVILFSWDGTEIIYEITAIEKKKVMLRGKGQNMPKTEPKKRITLFQALPNKYEKIEYILQKWVEVGIQQFVFFRSDYSQKLVLSPSKQIRFQDIAKEALEQCGGLVMPAIRYLEKFPEPLQSAPNIILDTIWTNTTLQSMSQYQDIGVWVGPEGGWSPLERAKMESYGFINAHLWDRVLRTETAGIVVSFALIHS